MAAGRRVDVPDDVALAQNRHSGLRVARIVHAERAGAGRDAQGAYIIRAALRATPQGVGKVAGVGVRGADDHFASGQARAVVNGAKVEALRVVQHDNRIGGCQHYRADHAVAGGAGQFEDAVQRDGAGGHEVAAAIPRHRRGVGLHRLEGDVVVRLQAVAHHRDLVFEPEEPGVGRNRSLIEKGYSCHCSASQEQGQPRMRSVG